MLYLRLEYKLKIGIGLIYGLLYATIKILTIRVRESFDSCQNSIADKYLNPFASSISTRDLFQINRDVKMLTIMGDARSVISHLVHGLNALVSGSSYSSCVIVHA